MSEFDQLFKQESGRILATLIRILGDFDTAEEALQEAFLAALQQWPLEGKPKNPVSWLISTARNRAVDKIRRDARLSLSFGEDISIAGITKLIWSDGWG